MGRNNNNAGMHFVRHSNNKQYDNLRYYDEKSAEGIANRRYESMANLEEMGDYLFTKSVGFIQISTGDGEFDFPKMYRLLIYDAEHEQTLKFVSTIKSLNSLDNANVKEIRVREHDRQHIIYITSELYEKNKHIITSKTIYELKLRYK